MTEKLRGRSVYKKLKRDANEQQQKNVIKEKKLREEKRKRAANAPKREEKRRIKEEEKRAMEIKEFKEVLEIGKKAYRDH